MDRLPSAHNSAVDPRGVAPALPSDAATRASLEYCHKVARKRARNFYYGLKLTPEPKRSAVYAIYAFMRACDDMADGAAAPEAAKRNIEDFRAKMQHVLDGDGQGGLPDGPIWPAFGYVTRTYSIEPQYLHDMLDAQAIDLVKHRYQHFDELYDYCYKVASVVGQVCIDIWGHDGMSGVRKLAEHRGIALQLTNILRDLAEDARRGRVYLPQEDLERFGYSTSDLMAGRLDERFDRLMRFQIERAWRYYQMSAPLEPHLSADCRPTSWAMMRIYRGLLEQISARPRQVMTQRVRLGSLQKLTIAAHAAWKKSWSNDKTVEGEDG